MREEARERDRRESTSHCLRLVSTLFSVPQTRDHLASCFIVVSMKKPHSQSVDERRSVLQLRLEKWKDMKDDGRTASEREE